MEAARAGGRGAPAAAYGRALESDGLSRLALEADLRGAIERGEIEAFFQPIVRLATGEALRLRGAGAVAPPAAASWSSDDFLGLMAEMGMMADLGAHMMRATSEQLGAWRRGHPAVDYLTCSVNLSTGEIDRPGLVDEVADLVSRKRSPAEAGGRQCATWTRR